MQTLHALLEVLDLRAGKATCRIGLRRQQPAHFRVAGRVRTLGHLHGVVAGAGEALCIGGGDGEGERAGGRGRAGERAGGGQRQPARQCTGGHRVGVRGGAAAGGELLLVGIGEQPGRQRGRGQGQHRGGHAQRVGLGDAGRGTGGAVGGGHAEAGRAHRRRDTRQAAAGCIQHQPGRQAARADGEGVRRHAAADREGHLVGAARRGRGKGTGRRGQAQRGRGHLQRVVLHHAGRGAGGAVGHGDGEREAARLGRRAGQQPSGGIEGHAVGQRTCERVAVRRHARRGGDGLLVGGARGGGRQCGRRHGEGRAGHGQGEAPRAVERSSAGAAVGRRGHQVETAGLGRRSADGDAVGSAGGDRQAGRQVGYLVAAVRGSPTGPGEGLAVSRTGHCRKHAVGADDDGRVAHRHGDRGRRGDTGAVAGGVGEAVTAGEARCRLVTDGGRAGHRSDAVRRGATDRHRTGRPAGQRERHRRGRRTVGHRGADIAGYRHPVGHGDRHRGAGRIRRTHAGAAVGGGHGEVERAQLGRRAAEDTAGRHAQSLRHAAGGDRVGVRRGAAAGRADGGGIRLGQGCPRQSATRQHQRGCAHGEHIGLRAGVRTRRCTGIGRGHGEGVGAARGGRTGQHAARAQGQARRQHAGGDGIAVTATAAAGDDGLGVGNGDRRGRQHRRRDGDRLIIIEHGHGALRIGERGIGGGGQVDREGLVGLRRGVAVDGDRDGLGGRAGCEGQRPAGADVVGGRDGAGIGGGVVDGDRLPAHRRQRHRQRGRDRTGVAFGHRGVVDGQRGHGVVVDDRARALAVGDGGTGHVADIDQEGFIGLVQRVAVDQHGEGRAAAAGGNGLPGQRLGDIVAAGGGGAIGRGDVEADPARARRRVERHGEGEGGGAAVALIEADVTDAQRRLVVIQDRAGRTCRCADGIAGACSQRQHHGLIGFHGAVGGGRDGDRAGGGPGCDRQRRGHRRVVGAAGGSAAHGIADRQRHQARLVQGDGVDQRGAAVFVDRGRGYRDRRARHVVVEDRAGGAGRGPDGVAAAGRDGEDHRFIGLHGGIGGGVDRDRRGGRARRNAHRRHAAGVIHATGRGAAGGQVDHGRRGQVEAAGDGVDQVGRPVLADAGRRHGDADAGRRAHGQGEVLHLEIAAGAGAAVGDAEGDRIGAGGHGGGTADHACIERQTGGKAAGFHRVGVGCNATGGSQRLRERHALDGRGRRRSEAQAGVLHGAAVGLVGGGRGGIGGAYGEGVRTALGGRAADHSGVEGNARRWGTGLQREGVRRGAAAGAERLRYRRAGGQGERGRCDHDRGVGRGDGDRDADGVAIGVGEFEDITGGGVAAVTIIDEPVAAGDAQVGGAVLRQLRTVHGALAGQGDRIGAGRDVDRHRAAIADGRRLGRTDQRGVRGPRGGGPQRGAEQDEQGRENTRGTRVSGTECHDLSPLERIHLDAEHHRGARPVPAAPGACCSRRSLTSPAAGIPRLPPLAPLEQSPRGEERGAAAGLVNSLNGVQSSCAPVRRRAQHPRGIR
ncbi:hypothetical protein D3C86_686670 [compost metagenome]